MDAPSPPAGRTDSDPRAAATPDTDQERAEDPPAVLPWKAAHKLSDYWGRPPRDGAGTDPGSEPTPRG